MTDEPMTQLAEAAAQMHELFASYVAAGFTEQQALRLVIAVLTAGIRADPPGTS